MTTTATDLERLFNRGIAAYQQGEYEQAKAALLKLSRCSNRTYRTKAGMGLVRIYMAQQDWESAQNLCQRIGHNPKPAVQHWAQKTLDKIQAKAGGSLRSDNVLEHTESAAVEQLPAGISIFHYAYLNGELAENGEPALAAATAQSDGQPEHSQSEAHHPHGYGWSNAGRLAKGRTLGKMKRTQLWFAQGAGAIAFYTLLLSFVHGAIAPINRVLTLLCKILPDAIANKVSFLPAEYGYWAWRLSGTLLVLAIAAPWLWDLYLRLSANRQPFSTAKLREFSPEAATLLNQCCQKKRWPFPTLWKLSTPVPLIFSYGWLPRNARLVVSEGLLSQLSAEEIATLVRYEMSHWKTLYWPLLSLQGLILQLFHQIYWQLALRGNSLGSQPSVKPPVKALIWLTGTIANVSYVMFWLLQLPGLWLSRVRTYYGDRAATEATGNPNALARALAKLSFGLADSITTCGYTPAMVESLTLLLPVCADLPRQSLYGSLPLAELFAWDSLNPLRNWMSISDAHPPLGDRLRQIMAYAQHWKLDLEIPLAALPKRRKGLSQSEWARLISQGMPFFGLAFGFAIGLLLLLLGAIGHWLSWPTLDWMHQDKNLLYASTLMGFSLGTMLRINRFFPDLPVTMPPSQDLSHWMSDLNLLPITSVPAKFSGTLMGRPGLANWLGQDLILKTSEAGLLKLHFFSTLGPFGNVVNLQSKPTALLGKSVQVLGWFRRGNRPWLDIDKLQPNHANGTPLQANHPMLSLWVVITTGAMALWLLGFGQIFHETINKLR